MHSSALVTGAGGHDGRLLTGQLLARGYRVIAMVRPGVGARLPPDPRCRVVEVDLEDAVALRKLIRAERPAEIYNLAANSAAGGQWETATSTLRTNGLAVQELLEIVYRESPESRFCQASSCEMFGASAPPPQTEATAIRPDTPYAIAKAQAHFSVIAYRQTRRLFACSAILFSHSSEYRSGEFLLGKVTRAAAEVDLGTRRMLSLKNLRATRDWGYAGDYMDAMQRMLAADSPEDYVVATGLRHTVEEACEVAFGHVDRDFRDHVSVEDSDNLVGGADFLGDATKIGRDLAWAPSVDFVTMIKTMVDYHRLQLEKGD